MLSLRQMLRRYLPGIYGALKFLKSTIANRRWLELIDTDTGRFEWHEDFRMAHNPDTTVEIQSLRQENENLRIELNRFLHLRHLLSRTLKILWIDSLRVAGHIQRKFR